MITEVFPNIYRKNYDLQGKIKFEERKSDLKIERLKKGNSEYVYRNWPLIGACAGFSLGVLILFIMGLRGLTYFVVIWILGAIIGNVIYKAIDKTQSIESKRNRDLITLEETKLVERIEELKKSQRKDFEEYTRQFEINVNEKCNQYNESEIVKNIVLWMIYGFFELIDNADRSETTQNIKTKLIYNVFYDQISCELNAEPFKLNDRYRLQNNLEQVALSKAIAEEINLYVVTKYPNDMSGTSVEVGVDTQYMVDHSKVSVTYTAENGNFLKLVNHDRNDFGGE